MKMSKRIAELDAAIGSANAALIAANIFYEKTLCGGTSQSEIQAAHNLVRLAREELNMRIDTLLAIMDTAEGEKHHREIDADKRLVDERARLGICQVNLGTARHHGQKISDSVSGRSRG